MIYSTKIQKRNINTGDILIYSEEKAYLIVENNIEFNDFEDDELCDALWKAVKNIL